MKILISQFLDINTSKIPVVSRDLDEALNDKSLRKAIKHLRSLPYGSEAFKEYKRAIPCYTPSGLFRERNAEGLIQHSGMLALDFDHIEDIADLKDLLRQLPFIYYAGLSCSGTGVFAIVKIADPAKHRAYFDALSTYFANLGYEIDQKCKDVCRLRVGSWDDDPIWNRESDVWNEVLPVQPIPEAVPLRIDTRSVGDTDERLFLAGLDYIRTHGIDITADRNTWLALGSMCKTLFGCNGLSYYIALSRFYPTFSERECCRTYDSLRTGGYGIGVFASACSKAGIPNLSELIKR